MIIGSIIEFVLNIFLFPLDIVNVGINFFIGIDWVVDIVNLISYVLPWENILPLIVFIISIFVFRITISLIKTIWDLLPLA